MANYYNLDGIKTGMEKEIERWQKLLAAWEKVSFPTKKDGTPFKVLSKNINGATLFTESYSVRPGENKLRVNTWTDFSGWQSDEIYCYKNVEDIDAEKKVKVENYQPKQSMLKQVYTYDIEDIKKAVTDRIELLKDRIQAMQENLNNANAAYKNFESAFSEAIKNLEKDAGKDSDPTLYYAIVETIKYRYPYC